MSFRLLAAALLAASTGFASAPTPTFAQANPLENAARAVTGEDHLGEAVTHTREAVGAGADRNAATLTEHANAALEHANAAQSASPNTHTKMGVKHLKDAVRHGKMGHAKIAKKHAEMALTHLIHAQETAK